MSLRDDVLKPITGDNPGGVDLRNEPVYLQIREVRREDDALPQGEWEEERKPVDYKQVVKLARSALTKKTKDLWIVAWLTKALLRRDGFSGLREGLGLLESLLEQFWDHLYPAIEEKDDLALRVAPLSWVGQYLVIAVKSVPLTKPGHDFLQYMQAQSIPTDEDAAGDDEKKARRESAIKDGKLTPEELEKGFADTPKPWYKELVGNLNGCLEALGSLEKRSEEKFSELDRDETPYYLPLRNTLTEVQKAAQAMLNKKLELDPDPPEPESDTLTASSMASEGAGADAGSKAIPIDPTDSLDAAARVAAAARFLQREDPRNPASYLMLRGFRWGELRAQGKELDPRQLSAPPTATRTRLKSLLLDANWPQLLEEGEMVMAMPHGRGWLDLQRYVLTACDALGSEYDYVAASIRGALAGLLRDLPDLPQLTLMDDTPTANAETRGWLRDVLTSEEAAGAVVIDLPEGEAAAPVAAERPSAEATFGRAMGLVRSGQLEKGIELLMSAAEQEKSPRDRFLRRAQAAGIMVDAKMEAVAMPILEELVNQVEAHKLEEWEAGDVVARPMGLLYRCMTALNTDSETNRKNLYLRVCRLDPLQAIAFPNDKGGGGAATAGAVPEAGTQATDG